MTLTEKIQKEFNQELLASSQISDMIIQENPNKVYLELEKYGFNQITNLNLAKTIDKENKIKELINEYKQFLKERELFTNKKIITFAKLHKILNKYNLYMGSISGYVKELPKKNAEEVLDYINYITNLYKKNERQVHILKTINKRPYNILTFGDNHPYSFILDKRNYVSQTTYFQNLTFFICASLDSFKKENRFAFENQVFWNTNLNINLKPLEIPNPDPIILNPIGHPTNDNINKLGLFEIVTAWDRESMDTEIFNVKNN